MSKLVAQPSVLRSALRASHTPHLAVSGIIASQYQVRHSSHSPLGTPISNPRKKVTINTLRALYQKNEPITMLTAHDFPSGHVADVAGMEMILVGDSLAMVALGMEDTSEVVLDEMILHCRSVARAAKFSFTVRFMAPSPTPVTRLASGWLTTSSSSRLVTSPWAPTKSLQNKLSNPLSA